MSEQATALSPLDRVGAWLYAFCVMVVMFGPAVVNYALFGWWRKR